MSNTRFGLSTKSSSTRNKSRPRTLAEMISAGSYIEKDLDFNERAFAVNHARFTTELAKVIDLPEVENGGLSLEETLALLHGRGLRAGGVEELLAYSAANADREYVPVIALGSPCKRGVETDDVVFPCFLDDEDGHRHLWILRFEGLEEMRYQYLVFPNH